MLQYWLFGSYAIKNSINLVQYYNGPVPLTRSLTGKRETGPWIYLFCWRVVLFLVTVGAYDFRNLSIMRLINPDKRLCSSSFVYAFMCAKSSAFWIHNIVLKFWITKMSLQLVLPKVRPLDITCRRDCLCVESSWWGAETSVPPIFTLGIFAVRLIISRLSRGSASTRWCCDT